MPEPAVACILVNWNNWQDTSACLASLAVQDCAGLSVIVVDNASSNDSLAQLRRLHPWATYLANAENLGFPKACNLGARHPAAAGASFLWFLNNDTIAPPDTLRKLLVAAAANPCAGIIGAVLRYMHAPDRVQAWGGGTISRRTGYNSHFVAQHRFGKDDYITFASAFVRRATYDEVGGLYEGAFMYFEDVDFSLRAQAAGWTLAVAGDTAILHKEGGSDVSVASSPFKDRTTTLAGLLFLTRHSSTPAVSRALFLGSRLAKRVLGRRWGAVRAVLDGAVDFRRAALEVDRANGEEDGKKLGRTAG